MSVDNKAVMRRFVEEILNNGNAAVASEFFTSDFVFHFTGRPEPLGRDGFLANLQPFRLAFPDIRFTAEDMIAEGERVAVRFSMRGTHRGEFQGIAPTGKLAQWNGIAFFRFSGGKIAEEWAMPDVLGLLRQLGAAR